MVLLPDNGGMLISGHYSRGLNIGQFHLVSLRGYYDYNAYIAKIDTSGQAVWATSIDKSIGELEVVGTDSLGYIYTTGAFSDTLIIANNTLIAPVNGSASFIAKLDANGNFLWAKQTADYFVQNASRVDRAGDFYLSYSGDSSSVLLKFDSDGSTIWRTVYAQDPLGYFLPYQMRFDSHGSLVISGWLLGQVQINGQVIGKDNEGDFQVVKFSRDGVLQGFSNNVVPLSISGWGPMEIDGGDNIISACSNTGIDSKNTFLVKYDSLERQVFVIKHDPAFGAIGLAIDELDDVFVTGNFQGSLKWGNQTLMTNGSSAYIVKLNKEGQAIWAMQNDAPIQTSNFAVRIRRSEDGSLYVAGLFAEPFAVFGNVTLAGNNQDAFFLLKIKDETPNLFNKAVVSDTVMCENPIQLNVGGFMKYLWQDGSKDSTYTADKPGTYYVTATDFLGGIHSDTIHVNKCNQLFVPNVITPNGDGKNDFFVIQGLDITKNNKLIVLDRWGKEVYSTNSYKNNWNGAAVSSGVFYFTMTDQATHQSYRGWLEILK